MRTQLENESVKEKVVRSEVMTLVKEAREFSAKHGVVLDDILDAIGMDSRTFSRWERKEFSQPRMVFHVTARMKKVRDFFKEAEKTIPHQHLPIWLNNPDSRLLGFPPIKCLSTDEGYEKVMKILAAFRWGLT